MSWYDFPQWSNRRRTQIAKDITQAVEMRELKCNGNIVEDIFYQLKLSNQWRTSLLDTSLWHLPSRISDYLNSVEVEQSILDDILRAPLETSEKCHRLSKLTLSLSTNTSGGVR